VRLDATTAAVYNDPEGTTLFRHGVSKDHRPDLAQFKLMLAALDPLGLPLASLVAAGNTADDALYRPAIDRARRVVGTGGRLYIGDVKMAALATRGYRQAAGDYYLAPLPLTGDTPARLGALVAPVLAGARPVERLYAPAEGAAAGAAGPTLMALGYEATRPQAALVADERVSWTER